MFCKMQIGRYFVTFIIDNNVTVIFNMGSMFAPNQSLCEMQFSEKFITKFNWWCSIIVLIYRGQVESYSQICAMTTVLEIIAQIYLPLFASLDQVTQCYASSLNQPKNHENRQIG